MVCACSSTTAIKRLHMIWVWICASAALGRATMSGLPTVELNIAEAIDGGVERWRDDGGGVVLGDDGRAFDARAGGEFGAVVDRRVDEGAGVWIEHGTARGGLGLGFFQFGGDGEFAFGWRGEREHPTENFDFDAGDRAAVETAISFFEQLRDFCRVLRREG